MDKDFAKTQKARLNFGRPGPKTRKPNPLSRSEVMARVKSFGNKATEMRLAALFRRYQIRGWRRHWGILGKPDFVFPKIRVAIFVDGCFWHGHPTLCRIPATNRSYWIPKIAGNRARDRLVNATLRKQGWHVVRIWEHRLAPKYIPKLMSRIERALCQAGRTGTKEIS